MIFIIIAFIALDQLSKYLFYDLWYYENSIFLFQPTLNDGISWSIDVNLILVIAITILFIIFLIWFLCTKHIDKQSFIFLFVWTIWNLIDRIFYNGVRDWIRLWWWPVFNIADIFISIGLLIYIYINFIKKE